MIGKLAWDIRSGNDVLPVTTGTINIDDQNIPAITASVMVPFDAAVLERLDPRSTSVPRVTIVGTYSVWASQTLGDVTEYLAANNVTTLGELSTLWDGLDTYDITRMFGAPLDSNAPHQPETMALDLHVREISYDDFEMTLMLASDEALLTDWAVTSFSDAQAIAELSEPYPMDEIVRWTRPVVQAVTGRKVLSNVYDTTELSVPAVDISGQIIGTTAWNLMRPYLEDTDLKLRVGRQGVDFTLQRPENELPGKPWFSLLTHREVISAKQVRSRTGDWYDSAILHRPSEEGISRGYPDGSHSRTYAEDWSGRNPTVSMARSIVRRTVNRGRFIDIVAPIRLGVFMRDEFTYAPFDGATGEEYQWAVKSVSYDLNTATMRIRGERRY